MTSPRCKILSLNVRGLKNRLKRRSVFKYLKDQNCLFYCLQETYSEPKDELIWRNEWRGGIFFSHGSNHQKGVCILLNPASKLAIEECHMDNEGRIVAVNVVLNNLRFSICNIYAPNCFAEQTKFAQTLNAFLLRYLSVDKLIIGGDWNVTLGCIDKKGGAKWVPSAYRDKVISMLEDLDLVDIFRQKKPLKMSFTYESKFLKVKSRIDFFLVSNSLCESVLEVDTKASIAPDHKAVKLCLQLLSYNRGPGLWKFNNSLLDDERFINLINANYPKILDKYREIQDKRLLWELIKMEIRGLTIPYSKNKARINRQVELNILKRIEVLDELISSSDNLQNIDAELNEYEHLKKELKHIYEKKGEAAIFRSKVRWTQEGEKPTKYFFNIEKKNYTKKVISELKTGSDGNIIIDEAEIMKEIHSFYAQLYKSEMESDVNQDNLKDFEDFTNELFIPRLSNPERDAIEGILTIEECKEALNTFNSGKSPGEDGFTVEFYNTFFALLGKDHINCLNESYDLGEMSISQRRGVISLVPKDDSYLLLLSNWRPITLLNVDYKIASKAIAKRIESVLPKLIHSESCFYSISEKLLIQLNGLLLSGH